MQKLTKQPTTALGQSPTNDLRFSYSGPRNKIYTPPQKCISNQTINFDQLVSIITSSPPKELAAIRHQMTAGLKSGLSWKQIKTNKDYSVSNLKKELPWFLCSGICPTHHNDKTLTYNGCIQIDIDFKFCGGDFLALQVLEAIKEIDYIKLATISPSGYGVKAIVQTTNLKKASHNESQKQVIADLTNKLDFDGITFDALGASQPCYIPYNSNPYYNEDSSVFTIQDKTPTTSEAQANVNFTPASPDAITAAIEYVKSEGLIFENGRHLFLYRLAIGFNLFGISHSEFTKYVFTHYLSPGEKQSNFDSPFLEYKDNFGAWAYKLEAADQKSKTVIIPGKEGDYLSDISTWKISENAINVGPTDSGKTRFLMNVKGKKIVFCPVLSLVDNIMGSYSHLNPVAFTGESKPTLQQLNTSDAIITTYASFPALRETLNASGFGLKNYRAMIDEIQSTTASGHQLQDLTKIVNASNEFWSFTGFTGTDLPSVHPTLKNMKRVIFDIPRPPGTYEILEVEHTLKGAKVLLERAANGGKKVIILQNKKNTSKNRETLRRFIDREDIWYFDSNSKENPDYKEFVKTGIIPNHINGIVTTTVIETGLSILTKADYEVIILGNHHAVTIEQIRKRPRKADSCHVYILKSKNRTTSDKDFNFLRYQQYILKAAQSQCDALNFLGELSELEAQNESFARQAIQKFPIFLCEKSGRYEVDLLGVSNYTYNQQTTACNRNDALMEKELAKYQIYPSKQTTKVIGQVPTRDEEKRATEGRDALEASNKDQYNDQVILLDAMPDAATYCSEAIHLHSAKLKPAEKIVFKSFLDLSEYGNQDQVIFWLKQNQKAAERKRLLRRLKMKVILDDSSHMKKNTSLVLILRKLRDSFSEGEVLTSEIIKGRVIDCLKLDKTIHLKPFIEAERSTKVIEIARSLFEVRKKQRKENGKVIIEWVIGNLSFEGTYNKTKIKVTLKTINPTQESSLKPGIPPYKTKTKVTACDGFTAYNDDTLNFN